MPGSASSSSDESYQDQHVEITLLAISKRIGLSFDELNELRIRDLLKLADAFMGNEKPREATQADIDRFYSG